MFKTDLCPLATGEGASTHKLYSVWSGMMQRCYDPNNPRYHRYGGRGIKVHEPWHSAKTFIEQFGPRPADGMQLDRIDNDGDYEPGNLRWVMPKENNRNRYNKRMIEYQGQVRLLVEVAEEIGIGRRTLASRLDTGHPDPFSPIVGKRFPKGTPRPAKGDTA